MGRKFYVEGKDVIKLTQGSIIPHCIADGYEGREVWGIIITARCDIEHNKVKRVYYLPVVSLSDWYEIELEGELRKIIKSQTIEKIRSTLQKYNIGRDFFNIDLDQDAARALGQGVITKPTDLEDYNSHVDELYSADSKSIKSNDHRIKKQLSKKAEEIFNNGDVRYYLIDSWNSRVSPFYVILLREIKSITIDMAKLLSKGFYYDDVDQGMFWNCDMDTSRCTRGELLGYECQVSSPFIEHIMQRFINTLCRIGLEDSDLNIFKTSLNGIIDSLAQSNGQ